MVSKVIAFCVEPTAFSPIAQKLNEIAIERHTSKSEVIADILFSYFGIQNTNTCKSDRKTLDFSAQIKRRNYLE